MDKDKYVDKIVDLQAVKHWKDIQKALDGHLFEVLEESIISLIVDTLVAENEAERWKTVALCHVCKPTAGNYCPDHYESMNAPQPWGNK